MTIVMVTHSPEAAALGTVRLRMRGGAMVAASPTPAMAPVA